MKNNITKLIDKLNKLRLFFMITWHYLLYVGKLMEDILTLQFYCMHVYKPHVCRMFHIMSPKLFFCSPKGNLSHNLHYFFWKVKLLCQFVPPTFLTMKLLVWIQIYPNLHIFPNATVFQIFQNKHPVQVLAC